MYSSCLQEFGYGIYDGISGLVTQPLDGAKKEGFLGLIKGFGKGIGGVVLKPQAGKTVFSYKGTFLQKYTLYHCSILSHPENEYLF